MWQLDEGSPRVSYDCGEDGDAGFVRVCEKCHRFVKPDKEIYTSLSGISEKPNATCSKCGRISFI